MLRPRPPRRRAELLAVATLLASGRGDSSRTPVVLYPPHGGDQLALLEQATG
ncbi:MAG: hypothetical protein ACRENB_04170 [Gemmatimonadales bacterium]